ncbi:PAM [Mytilus coruscus]|uniref:PAM n=1 Tax=Mytilus coruscus TaxID=42192 RepID=A0A6J8AED9_MYTCO|nr:PAM [Mytilus coruscus]
MNILYEVIYDNEHAFKERRKIYQGAPEALIAIHDKSVMNITIRMPKTQVPNTETNYMCTMFDLPNDGDFYMIASVPYIVNNYVMHHMLMFGCEDTDYVRQIETNKPKLCQIGVKGCSDIMSVWTVGYAGHCASKEIGFRIGVKGYKRVLLQIRRSEVEVVGTCCKQCSKDQLKGPIYVTAAGNHMHYLVLDPGLLLPTQ